jgi:hypothetical protein
MLVAAPQLDAAPALSVSIRANTVVELRLNVNDKAFSHDLVLWDLGNLWSQETVSLRPEALSPW